MLRVVTVLVTVLGVTACGADGESSVSDAIEVAAGEIELDRAAIVARERAWLDARPAAYSYEVQTTCECVREGTYTVTVVGEEVFSIESHEPGAEPYRRYSPPVLDAAFAMLDEPLALAEDGEIPEGRASAAFDPTFGFPASFTVTGSGGLPSYHVEVRRFVPLDPATIDRTSPGLTLVISNQSFGDPDVELTVIVDGEVVVDRSFAVENQHVFLDYHLPLGPGEHELTIRADTGATHERIVTLGSQRHYLYVAYWGGDAASPETFSVDESDEPFVFA